MNPSEIKQALAGCEFFEGLGDGDLEQIMPLCWPRDFQAGQYVFEQGNLGEHLHLIVDGQVVLERSVNLGVRKGTVTIEDLGQGRVLGSWSTLLGQRHLLMSSARCQRPTRLLVMRGADLRNLMLSDKEFGFNIMEKFCFLLKDRIQAAYGALEKL
ncbi:MAG: Crp/Fnr family transcriptional regulator [Desulfobacteraceae bacterium 4572_123]|nr:MAG: Crp/Fnr family transcriptional regulator [Desulfobacteraceae bacterium 4572_123]